MAKENYLQEESVFWKMHVLECCFISFVENTGMTGRRASTEGSEAKHFDVTGWKQMLSPVIKTQDRISKLSQRQQVCLMPGLAPKFDQVRKKTKTYATRGPQKTKAGRRIEEDGVVVVDEESDDNTPEGFFSIYGGGILPVELYELYSFYKRSKVPTSWSDPFQSTETMGNKATADAMYHSDL